MNSSAAAEEIVKISLDGMEVAVKIAGTGIKNIVAMIWAMSKNEKLTKGETKLKNMLKSGRPLKIFSLKEDQLGKFHEEAKKYGVLYTALVDKKNVNQDGIVDIMVKDEDAFKVNHIVDRFNLGIVDIASIRSEIEKDNIEENLETEKLQEIDDDLVNDILSKPDLDEQDLVKDILNTETKESTTLSNPNLEESEQRPQSENSSKIKNYLEANSNNKPSVRQTLKKIKQQIADKKNMESIDKQSNAKKGIKIKSKKDTKKKRKKEKSL